MQPLALSPQVGGGRKDGNEEAEGGGGKEGREEEKRGGRRKEDQDGARSSVARGNSKAF